MPSCYFNTYEPLVASRAGRIASEQFGIPPFVDGSIRREPDLEHRFPSISCLCRAGKFAPRLKVNDLVAYLTRKRSDQRLTAVLQVLHTFPSHEDAAEWYSERKLPLPANCMVPGNSPKPLAQSHRIVRVGTCLDDAQAIRRWDAEYRGRARAHKVFVVCKPLYRELSWDALVIKKDDFLESLGRVPGTQNPGAIKIGDFLLFMRHVGVSVSLSSP